MGIYLFCGTEVGEKQVAIDNLQKNAEKKFGKVNVSTMYAFEDTVADAIQELSTPSLFGGISFVVMKCAEKIREKSDVDALLRWIKSDNDGILVLTSEFNSFGEINKRLETAVPGGNKKIFWEMFENQKPSWVKNFFAKNSRKIETDAVDLILKMVENNTLDLSDKCSRFLTVFPPEHVITSEDVENILFHTKEETVFSLFDAMGDSSMEPAQRISNAFSILQTLQLSSDSAGFQIVLSLASCFRRLKQWHFLSKNGLMNDAELRKNGFSSKKAQTQMAKASKIWNLSETNTALAQLSSFDKMLRTTPGFMDKILVQLCVYGVMTKRPVNFLSQRLL